ncbi:uncharacterized protein LOC113238426 isoform X2 [Hyposmocoma kahamanoa]|uniref:uncharacterized protein LOC113238426 isoform X2 n=1 Tax=Hyposmocoma kahamanoa TaxID=1477025 RepID=UPI000E6DA0BB|nr:uncharacterized protein LOC113238426 isoform X2 [Hyposmocoma kahamanoa]
MNNNLTNITCIILFIIFSTAFYLVMSFTPITKEEHVKKYQDMQAQVEPFRKNISECAHQVKASMVDIETFLKRVPQSTMQGKCFIACILKRNAIIKNNKVDVQNLIAANKEVYGEDSEVLVRLKTAVNECLKVVDGIFEICEYASIFNDCMHMKTEHLLDKLTMERRMEALGQMTSDPDVWSK